MKKFIFIIVLGCLAWGKSKAYESGERNRYRVYFPTASIILNPAFKENKATLDSLVIHIQNKQKKRKTAPHPHHLGCFARRADQSQQMVVAKSR